LWPQHLELQTCDVANCASQGAACGAAPNNDKRVRWW
jgi:hypothetical protein